MTNLFTSPTRRRALKERDKLFFEMIEINTKLSDAKRSIAEHSRLFVKQCDLRAKINLLDKILYNL